MQIAEGYISIVAKTGTLRDDITREAQAAGEAGGTATSQGLASGLKRSSAHKDAAAAEGTATGEAFGKNASDAMQKLWNVAKGAVIAQQIKGAITDATQLQQVVTAGKAVFGDNAAAIEKWSTTAATSMGLSRQAAEGAALEMTHLLENIGYTGAEAQQQSTHFVQLSSDLAAMYGSDQASVMSAFQSAMLGNTRAIRAYGIAITPAMIKQQEMTQAMDMSTPEAIANSKAMATMQLITEQTASSVGFFAENQQNAGVQAAKSAAEFTNAKTKLGTELLPVYTDAVKAIGALASGFGALPGPIQVVTVALGVLVAMRGPVMELGKALAVAMGAEAAAGFGEFALALAGIAATVGVVMLAFQMWNDRTSEVDKAAQTMTKSVQAAAQAIDISKIAAEGAGAAFGEFGSKLIDASAKPLTDLITKHANAAKVVTELGTSIDTLKQAIYGEGDATKTLNDLRAKAISQGLVQFENAEANKTVIAAITAEWVKNGGSLQDVMAMHHLNVDVIGKESDATLNLIHMLEVQNAAQGKSTATLLAAAEAGDESSAKALKASAAFDQLTISDQAQVNAVISLASYRKDQADATQAATDATVADTAATKDQTAEEKAQQKVIDENIKKTKDQQKAIDDAAKAEIQSYKDVTDALKGNVDTQTASDKAKRDMIDQLPAYVKAMQQIKSEHADATTKMLDAKVAQDEFTQKIVDYSEKVAALSGPKGTKPFFDAQIQGLEDMLAKAKTNAPEMVQTIMDMIQSLKDQAAQIAFTVDWRIEKGFQKAPPTVTQKPGGGVTVTPSTTKDAGGALLAGQAAFIGTGAQPELFVPDTPGTMFPKGSYSLGGGGPVMVDASINVNAPVYGVDDLNALLDQHAARIARAVAAGSGRRG